MVEYGKDLLAQLSDPAYLAASAASIPPEYNVPNETPHPLFIQVDFGIDQNLEPKLVEIQGFPSLYAYQPVVAETYRDVYGLDPNLRTFLGSGDYWQTLRRAIVADHDPENVILMEIDPYHQKTLPDFLLTEKYLGVKPVSLTDIRKRGNRLFHGDVPIHRIYNRVIVDELQRKQIQPAFDFRDDLDVEWAGHPNWYFRISKFSLPFFDHPSVPKTWFLNRLATIPDDLEDYVLKPLYSFAGLGVVIGPTEEQLTAVDPSQFILQEKVDFAPVIETPHGGTKAEVRVMYIWPDGATQPEAVMLIVRMGRGKMIGVDHNRDLEWVGASAGFVG
ncbi:MAG TPA: hypothetical protein VKT81_11865 [Bryobacteraceae bacterium]|nr:hypothetical protein [Bryobacteraceae bacterium]